MALSETSFKPGQSGNPSGKAKLPPELLALKKKASIEFEMALYQALLTPLADTLKILNEHDKSGIQHVIASIFSAAASGSEKHQRLLLDRAFGTVKAHISIDGGEDEDGASKPLQIQRVDLLERLKQIKGETNDNSSNS